MKRMLVLCAALAALSPPAGAYDDLTILSDEFDAAHSVTNWQRIYQVEGWGNDVLQQFDINTTRSGRITMVPYTSSWYAEWRGELTFKSITGDFVITTDVEPRNRAGTGAPGSQYSLAGIMVRAPRAPTPGEPHCVYSPNRAPRPGLFTAHIRYRR